MVEAAFEVALILNSFQAELSPTPRDFSFILFLFVNFQQHRFQTPHQLSISEAQSLQAQLPSEVIVNSIVFFCPSW